MNGNAYRDGRVHVMAAQCSTCIFRPGNLMNLSPGRVKNMVQESLHNEDAIICHKSFMQSKFDAVCRGFYDRYETQPLQIAKRLGLIEEDEL